MICLQGKVQKPLSLIDLNAYTIETEVIDTVSFVKFIAAVKVFSHCETQHEVR